MGKKQVPTASELREYLAKFNICPTLNRQVHLSLVLFSVIV